MRNQNWRNNVVAITALFILAPVTLIVWQSFLSDVFFSQKAKTTHATYRFVHENPGFWNALRNTIILYGGMVIIAVLS